MDREVYDELTKKLDEELYKDTEDSTLYGMFGGLLSPRK